MKSKPSTLDVAVVILAGRIAKASEGKNISSDPLYPTPVKELLDPKEVLYFVAQDRDHKISGQEIDQLTLKGHRYDTLSWRSTTITFGSKYLVPLYNFEVQEQPFSPVSSKLIKPPKIVQLDPKEYAIRLCKINDQTKELTYAITQPGLGIWRSDILRSSEAKYKISFMIIEPSKPKEKQIVGYYSFETKLKFTDK